MKEYNVFITETSQMVVTVKAESLAEAEESAEEKWNKSEYVLDSSHFKGAEFVADDGTLEQKWETIRVLVVKPNAEPEVRHIATELEIMKEIVGGNIECMHYYDEVAIICNRESKMDGLPLNRAIRDKNGEILDIIAGDFFLCNTPPTSEKFESLTDKQLEKYQEKFKNPDRFRHTPDGIKVVPNKPKAKDMER